MSPRAAFRTAEGWFRCATLGIAIGIGIGIAAIITLVVASRYVGATVDTDSDPDFDFAGAQSYGMLTHFCHDRHRLFAVTLRLGLARQVVVPAAA